MIIQCPNCGAGFPASTNEQGAAECPLCLHTFEIEDSTTQDKPSDSTVKKANAPTDTLPSSLPEDDFESFGPTGSFNTATIGSQLTNPFSMGKGANDLDPFADSSSASFSPKTDSSAPDPFAQPSSDDDENISFDALLGEIDENAGAVQESTVALKGGFLGDEDGEDSLFLATANTSGAAFDRAEEEEEEEEAFHAPLPRGLEDPKTALPPKKESPRPRTGRRVALLLLIGLGLGIGLDFAGIPNFGLTNFFGPSDEEIAQAKKPNIATNLLRPTELKDTEDTYSLEVSRLEQIVAINPNDLLMQRTHLNRLLDLYERFPDQFAKEPRYKQDIKKYQGQIKPFPPRYELLDLLAQGKLTELEPRLKPLAEAKDATPDALGVAAMVRMDLWIVKQRKRALSRPGLISRSDIDPLRADGSKDPGLKEAKVWLKRGREAAKKQPNLLKFDAYAARLRDLMGEFDDNIRLLPPLLKRVPEHNDLRLLLASAMLETNKLGQTANLLRDATGRAKEENHRAEMIQAWRLEARLAARRGRVPDLIVALRGVLKLLPRDELTRVRLARLLLENKRAAEARRVLIDGKKKGMVSIAFEVALVEYWLWGHRNKDALTEIVQATKRFPNSVDLLFLRGQVEDQQQHHATARDYFSKVIAREPHHMRAVLRLSELLAQAGRHDDALITLQTARERLGDNPALLEPMAKQLILLHRLKEGRDLYGLLLKKEPSNRIFLLNAARLDLKAGQVNSALRFLRILRDDGALDREGAIQMALALHSKNKSNEAAQTLMPFAEKEPTNMNLNTMTGKYLLDSDDIDRAVTFLKRAYTVAHRQGGDPETLFQYGRLAFRRGEVKEGSNRILLAIKSNPRAHRYRYQLARFLLKVDPIKHQNSRKVAVEQLRYLVLHADRFRAANNAIDYLDEVHRLLANYYLKEQQFNKAIPHLRKTLEMKPTDTDTRVNLGTALFQVNDPDAESVLRQVMKQRPKNIMAALYLGLISLSKNQSSEAMRWLIRASKSQKPEVLEAYYQLALIYRDRKQIGKAIKSLKIFLKHAPANHTYRQDAESLMKNLTAR